MAKRKKTKAATQARKAKTKAAGAPKAKRPDGSVSAGIYDAVQKLIADRKMTRTAAFKQIAKESGRKEGTVAVNYYYAAKKRGGGKKAAAKKAVAKSPPKAATAKKSGGGIAAAIYDAIEKLMAGGKLKRSEAFRQHAKATGRKEGTVAVNYYYAAKKRGGGAKAAKRGPGRPKMVDAARNGAGSSRIESALKALAELLRAQETELAALRRDNERFAALRRLIGQV